MPKIAGLCLVGLLIGGLLARLDGRLIVLDFAVAILFASNVGILAFAFHWTLSTESIPLRWMRWAQGELAKNLHSSVVTEGGKNVTLEQARKKLQSLERIWHYAKRVMDLLVSPRAAVLSFSLLFLAVFGFVVLSFGFIYLSVWKAHGAFTSTAAPNALDACVFSLTTITTAEFPDLAPRTALGKLLIAAELIWGLFSVSLLALCFSSLHSDDSALRVREWARVSADLESVFADVRSKLPDK